MTRAGQINANTSTTRYMRTTLTGLCIILTMLAGCSSVPKVVESAVEPQHGYQYLESETSSGRPTATAQLIQEGREAWQAGANGESLQKFGRALRISPDDGLIYYYLASVHKDEGETDQAAALARRGLFFAHQPILRERLNHLLNALQHASKSDASY